MSFSGSILPEADEYLTRPSRPRKRSTDDEYFSTPSKSRWHVEGHRADQTPDPQINTLYQFILSAKIGVERICFVGTSTLRSDSDCAHNTIYKPLLAISEQMQVLTRKVENWAHNAKYLQHMHGELTRIDDDQFIPMNLKYSKVSRRLDKVRPINGEYCFVFERTAGRLAPIRRQLGVLINFVNTICTEGNSLPVEDIIRSRGVSDATHDSDETISINATPHPPPPPLSAPTQHRLGEFPPEPMEPPRPAPHPSTPLWKIALSDKYEMENLFVGAEELAALEQTLQLAEDAKADIIRAELLCEQHCLFAHDMQEVFEEWIEKVHFWESRLRRRSDGDETELAWQELDEFQDQDQGYGSLKRKLGYEDSVWG